jgi:hypothetical protein
MVSQGGSGQPGGNRRLRKRVTASGPGTTLAPPSVPASPTMRTDVNFQFSIFNNTRPSCPVMTEIMFVFWTGHLGIWIICLFPIRGILMKTLQTKAVNGKRFHRAPTVMLHCFEECLMNFVVNLLLAESGTICLLQWYENCSITSSNCPDQFSAFHGF